MTVREEETAIPAARTRPGGAPRIGKRVFARLDKAGIPGTTDTMSLQRLTAYFGDLAPRDITERERKRYRAMCVAFGLDEKRADTDLDLLAPAEALGAAPAQTLSRASSLSTTAIPVAPAPGAVRYGHIDAMAEILGTDGSEGEARFVPDDQIDPVPENGASVEVDEETQEWLTESGRRILRVDAARDLAAAGAAAARQVRRARRRGAAEGPADAPTPDYEWQSHLAEAGRAVGRDELVVYKRSIRGSRGDAVAVAAAVLNLLGRKPPAVAMKKEVWIYRERRARALRLISFFGNAPADVVTDDTAKAYREAVALISYGVDRDDPKFYSYTTVQNDLIFLRRALREFQRECQLAWVPQFKVPTERVVRSMFLTRRQVARLLWACRGRIHDPVTDDWLVHEVLIKKLPRKDRRKWVWDGEPGTARDGHWEELKESYPGETVRVRKIDAFARRHRKGLAIAILIAAFAGLRHESIMRLVWGPHPTRGWIDVEEGRIHRFGFETPKTAKTSFPVTRIAPSLLAHLRRWHEHRKPVPKVKLRLQRGRKAPPREETVVRQANNQPYASSHQTAAFAKIVEAAGLDPHVVMHSLRHTAATWHAIMGTDCRQAARLLGMSLQTMDRIYTHWTPSDGEAAAAMWLDPAARRRLKAVRTVASGHGDRPRVDHAPPQQRPRRQESVRLKRLLERRAA